MKINNNTLAAVLGKEKTYEIAKFFKSFFADFDGEFSSYGSAVAFETFNRWVAGLSFYQEKAVCAMVDALSKDGDLVFVDAGCLAINMVRMPSTSKLCDVIAKTPITKTNFVMAVDITELPDMLSLKHV